MDKACNADVLVFEDAWPVFRLFSRMPWRRSLWDGSLLGVDWPQAESLARALGIVWDAQTVDDLLALESGAMEAARNRA